jgi:iron(III) transport system substrate-binding protein
MKQSRALRLSFKEKHCGGEAAMKTILALLISLAFAPAALAQSSDWQKQWDETLAAAKKEGKVVVVGSPDPVMRNEIIPKFTQKFGIQVDFLAGRSSQTLGRIRMERASGLHLVDVYMAGAGTTFYSLHPEKMIDPLKPLLILPEVTDASKWKRGKPWFADAEEQYVLVLFSSVESLLMINADHVKPEEIRSVQDLLNPKWKEKISSEDPKSEGNTGSGMAMHWLTELGSDYVRKLYIDQKPTFSKERRQLIDWLARGNYPICLSCKIEGANELTKEGFQLQEVFEIEGIRNRVTASPFLLSFANKAPNPNAARVFVNWIASKEALEIYSRENRTATMRTDVDESFLDPRVIPRPGVSYFEAIDAKWIATGRLEAAEKMQQTLKSR